MEALPEELRAEVLATQLSTRPQGDFGTPFIARININSYSESEHLPADFLAALPPEIQVEVIEQERREQERRSRVANQPPADISHAQDMDNASFIATLAPELREEVLLTADESLLASLPPCIMTNKQQHLNLLD